MRRMGWVVCLLCAGILLLAVGATLALTDGVGSSPSFWARTYGGTSDDVIWTVQQAADGGYVVGGYSHSFALGAADYWVVKLRQDGTVQWQMSYGDRGDEAADLIYQTADGGYLVTGYTASFGAGSIDMWLLKLAADGSAQWQKTYGGSREDEAVGIEQTRDGGYIMAGETKSYGAGDWDVWILKLRVDGRVEWQKTYGGSRVDTTSADPIQQTADGGYIVCGKTASFGAGDFDVWVLKLDANGAVEWQETYGGSQRDEAHAVRQTRDGGYAVAGFTGSFGTGGLDIWVLKLDAHGAVQWQKTIGGERDDLTWSVYHTTDGGCVVGGYTASFGAGDSDFWVLKFSPDGTLQWQKTYGGTGSDRAISIRQTSDGGYFVGGSTRSFGAGNADFWALRLDGNGEIPGCPLMRDSNATIVDTRVVGVDSDARISDTNCRVSDTDASARVSSATVREQCYAEPTPTPTPTPAPNNAPENVSVWPSSGGRPPGRRVNFTTTYRDLDGYRDLWQVFLHVGSTKNRRSACQVMYDLRRNKLYLLNNAGSRFVGGYAPGSARVIGNSQCKLNCAKSAVETSGRVVRAKWNLLFRAAFRGRKNLYLFCADRSGGAAPWQQKGTWRVR